MKKPDSRKQPDSNPAEQETRLLREEIDALHAAGEAKEQQLLAVTHAMDEMLLEIESQRNALKIKNKQLLELNAYIRSINDTMDSILVVADLNGKVTQTNRVFAEHLGWAEDTLLSLHIDTLFPAEVLMALKSPSNQGKPSVVVLAINRLGHLEREMQLLRNDGTVTETVYPVKGERFYSHQETSGGVADGDGYF